MNSLHNNKTVIILPETDDHTLCLAFRGRINDDDHAGNMAEQLQAYIDRQGWYNMMIVYEDDYAGWDLPAAARSMQSIIDHGPYARRLAYVNAPEKKIQQMTLMKPVMGAEIRFFTQDERAAALAWVKGGV